MRRAVIDQPGARIFLIGLALSIFLGLALRSQISETRIQGFLNKSIDRLQGDFYVDYETAKVNLSRWGLPLPALIIENIRLSPKSTICQSSQIYIEELEVPISIPVLLGFSKIVPKIRVKEIELRLSDIDECIGQKKAEKNEQAVKTESAEKTEAKSTAVATGISAATDVSTEAHFKNIFSNNTKAELREIYIEKLKIISKNNPDQPLLLKQINFELFYAENRLAEVQIKSKISALKDSRSDIYFLNAGLIAMLKSKEKNEIETLVNINGKLLDGDIQLFVHSFSGSNKLNYELGLQQVSLKALSPLFDHIEVLKNVTAEKIPISVSFINNGEVFFGAKKLFESKFKKLQVNVENGLIRINEVDTSFANSLFTVKPFRMAVESLSLTKLKNVEQFKNKLDSVDSLGELSGSLDFRSETDFRFKGNVKNIKAVFSNRGRRDLQNIDHIDLEAFRLANDFKLNATNFSINNQNVNGQLKAYYNTASFSSTAQLKLAGVTLNSKVWEQFTFVEQSPKIEILWNYKKSESELHTLKIAADKISLPGVFLENLTVDISQMVNAANRQNNLQVLIKPAKLVTDSSFFENEIIGEVLNKKNGFKLDSLTSSRTSLVLTGTDWKNISFNLDSHFLSEPNPKSDTYLSLKGSARYEEGLDARLVLQSRGQSLKFDMTRDESDKIVIKQLL